MGNNLIFDGTILHETGYFQVSNKIFDLNFMVKEVKKDEEIFRDLNIYEINIYFYLCRCANNKQNAFPSYNTIAEKTRCSRRKAIASIKILSENGFLYKETRYNKDLKKNNSNVYVINNDLDKLQKTLEAIHENNTSAQHALPSAQYAPPTSAQYAPPSAQHAPYKKQLKNNNIKKEQLNNNNKKKDVVVVEEERTEELIKEKLDVTLTKKEIKAIVACIKEKYEAFNEDVLLRALNATIYYGKTIHNLGGFINKAIAEDYAIQSYKKNFTVTVTDASNKDLKFKNFDERQYDYDDLEKKLLGWSEE